MATLTAPETVSMSPAGLDKVSQLFERQIGEGLHPGAGLAVYRYGQLVLDIYGGAADNNTGRRVDENTMFVLFSSTKPLAAACVYMLKERGRLEWDDPVAKFWPEFGQYGKDKVTVRQPAESSGRLPRHARGPALDRLARLGQGLCRHGECHPQVRARLNPVLSSHQLRLGHCRVGAPH